MYVETLNSTDIILFSSLLCKHMSWLRLEPFTAAQAEKDLSIFIGKVDISSFDLTE
jgi:hypothetical protein